MRLLGNEYLDQGTQELKDQMRTKIPNTVILFCRKSIIGVAVAILQIIVLIYA
jgi:hypothetical protein